MLWFNHPRPPHRKEVAVQLASAREEAPALARPVAARTPPVPATLQAAAEGAPLAPIRFSVSYTLNEYLAILHDHVAYLVRQDRHARKVAPGLLPALCCALAAGAAQVIGLHRLAYLAAGGVMLVAAACMPVMLRMWVLLLATPVFLFKRHRMPACKFSIDDERIERVTARGTMSRRWSEVLALRRYSQGYLLTFGSGAIPIPYRCLDGDQSRRLRAFAARRRTTTGHD